MIMSGEGTSVLNTLNSGSRRIWQCPDRLNGHSWGACEAWPSETPANRVSTGNRGIRSSGDGESVLAERASEVCKVDTQDTRVYSAILTKIHQAHDLTEKSAIEITILLIL
jgi:hypothetical protein